MNKASSNLRQRYDVIPSPGHEFEPCLSSCGLRNGDSQLSKYELGAMLDGRSFDLPLNYKCMTVMGPEKKAVSWCYHGRFDEALATLAADR